MNYKRIIAAHHGSGTVFELEDGMYALVDHEVSRDSAKFSVYANSFLRHGYFYPVEELPEGNCDADIHVMLSMPETTDYYGFGKRRLDQMLEHRERLRQEMSFSPDQIM